VQIMLAEGFEQAVNGALSKKFSAKLVVREGRNEDNRNLYSATLQFTVQLRSRHSRHRHVQYQAAGLAKGTGLQERLSGSKGHGGKSQGLQKVGQRLARRDVIIDDRYERALLHLYLAGLPPTSLAAPTRPSMSSWIPTAITPFSQWEWGKIHPLSLDL
jgi:hypothetical protein